MPDGISSSISITVPLKQTQPSTPYLPFTILNNNNNKKKKKKKKTKELSGGLCYRN
jgi:hypothetical protein